MRVAFKAARKQPGVGNVGYHAAKFLSQDDGCLVTAIIERDGAIHDEGGIDVDALRAWIGDHGGVSGYPKGTYIADGAAALEYECDILIPAALEGVINLKNAKNVKAPLIIEAANGPITAGADEVLRKKGCVIIPDLYANAGGVTRFGRMEKRQEEAQHRALIEELERLSADKGLGWELSADFKNNYMRGAGELELVRSGLDDTMRTAYQAMRQVWHEREDVEDLRMAAYLVSIERIAASYRAKGL